MAAGAKQDVSDLLSAAHPSLTRGKLDERLASVYEDARARGVGNDEIDAQLQSWAVQFPRRKTGWVSAEAAIADLRDLLIGPQSTTARAWHRMRRVASWVFDHYVAVAGLVTVIATGFYGLAYAWFYDSLDITPDQAGLGPTEILTRSVLGGLTLSVLISVALFAAFVPLIPLRDDPAVGREKGSSRLLVANACFTLLAAAVLFGLALIASRGYLIAAVVMAGVPVVLLLVVSFRPGRVGGGRWIEPRPLRFRGDKYLTLFVAAAIPAGLLLTGVVTLNEARLYGEQARAGVAVRDPKILGMPFLGVRAEPALISWTADEPHGAGIPHCVFYLGGTGGDQVFYDYRSRSALHIPPSEVTVELRSRMSTCAGPVNVRPPFITKGAHRELVCHAGRWQALFSPRYTFEWLSEGLPVSNDSKRQTRFQREAYWPRHRLYCQVSASNVFGRDVAVSRALWIGIPQG